MAKPNGVVFYEGPSMIDGAPIVAIATGLARASANPKTGDMVQTWIMRADVAPIQAGKDGDDASVCGGCKHRPVNGGTCYVSLFQGPRSVFAAYKTGGYASATPEETAALIAGRKLRMGSYGDPVAVPFAVWQALLTQASGHTGYTHQWASERLAGPFRETLQASVDNAREFARARAKGWATFRVRTAQEPVESGEFVCPASDEGGHSTTCEACGACNGKGSLVVIIAHGAKASRFGKDA